jgi:hypothetical protein
MLIFFAMLSLSLFQRYHSLKNFQPLFGSIMHQFRIQRKRTQSCNPGVIPCVIVFLWYTSPLAQRELIVFGKCIDVSEDCPAMKDSRVFCWQCALFRKEIAMIVLQPMGFCDHQYASLDNFKEY